MLFLSDWDNILIKEIQEYLGFVDILRNFSSEALNELRSAHSKSADLRKALEEFANLSGEDDAKNLFANLSSGKVRVNLISNSRYSEDWNALRNLSNFSKFPYLRFVLSMISGSGVQFGWPKDWGKLPARLQSDLLTIQNGREMSVSNALFDPIEILRGFCFGNTNTTIIVASEPGIASGSDDLIEPALLKGELLSSIKGMASEEENPLVIAKMVCCSVGAYLIYPEFERYCNMTPSQISEDNAAFQAEQEEERRRKEEEEERIAAAERAYRERARIEEEERRRREIELAPAIVQFEIRIEALKEQKFRYEMSGNREAANRVGAEILGLKDALSNFRRKHDI